MRFAHRRVGEGRREADGMRVHTKFVARVASRSIASPESPSGVRRSGLVVRSRRRTTRGSLLFVPDVGVHHSSLPKLPVDSAAPDGRCGQRGDGLDEVKQDCLPLERARPRAAHSDLGQAFGLPTGAWTSRRSPS